MRVVSAFLLQHAASVCDSCGLSLQFIACRLRSKQVCAMSFMPRPERLVMILCRGLEDSAAVCVPVLLASIHRHCTDWSVIRRPCMAEPGTTSHRGANIPQVILTYAH